MRSHELLRFGHRTRLQVKSFLVLHELLKKPGVVVTREELAAALWPKDYFVDAEHGLNTAVRRLREALGDSADAPRYIETLPRIGYRWVGAIENESRAVEVTAEAPPGAAALTGAAAPSGTASGPRSRRWRLVAALTIVAAVGCLVTLVALSNPWRAPRAGEVESLTAAGRVEDLLARARYLRNHKRAGEARPFVEEALRLDPKNSEALSGLAMSYMVEGDAERGRETALRALELDPNAWEAHRVLGNLAVRVGDLAAAERHFRGAVRAKPDDPKGRNRLARHFLLTGRPEEALEQMLESRRIAPDDPDVQNIWIHYALLTGDYESAIRHGQTWLAVWEKPLAASESLSVVRYELGLANVGARRASEAIEHFRAAGRGGDAYVALALSYTGRSAEAREILGASTDPPAGVPSETDREAAAMAWTAIGELDHAYAEIDRLIAAREYPSWVHFPLFEALRKDARWPALIAQLEREFLRGVERLPPSRPDGMLPWPIRKPAPESAPAS